MLDSDTTTILPVHPYSGLTAIGVLPSGRPVWPVLGGAPDDDDSGDGGQDDGGQDDDGSGSGDDGDGLAEAGKKALAGERKARREAERARKAAEAELAELRAAQAAKKNDDGDGAKPDAEQIRREAEQAATVKANERILRSEVKAAAAGKLADPADALAHLDLSKFEVGDDGSVDESEIADAIGDLLKAKPYLAARAQGFQGTGDGGPRGDGRSRQLGAADLKNMSAEAISKARQEGRLERYMAGGS